MKKCKCEHWQTCPVCYPQGFDEAGNRKPVEIPPTREEMLARIKELEADRDALAMQNQQMRDALESIQRYGFDMLSGRVDGPDDRAWQRSGVNEMTKRAQSALALLDTSEIIKRHDAAVLRKAAEHLEGYEYVFNAPPINYAEAHELRLMANELEKSCQP